MEWVNRRKLRLNKSLNDLDRFVLKFINILEKHTPYVIISGYVSILLGRSRGTEDVDLFIKKINKESFIKLYQDLKKKGFWCLNAEDVNEVYSYLEDGLAIRFANKGEAIPNFEVKIVRRRLDLEVFDDFIEVETAEGIIKISSLERQIAFKRYYLCSDKDLEDAQYIESLFEEHLDQSIIRKYQNDIIGK